MLTIIIRTFILTLCTAISAVHPFRPFHDKALSAGGTRDLVRVSLLLEVIQPLSVVVEVADQVFLLLLQGTSSLLDRFLFICFSLFELLLAPLFHVVSDLCPLLPDLRHGPLILFLPPPVCSRTGCASDQRCNDVQLYKIKQKHFFRWSAIKKNLGGALY